MNYGNYNKTIMTLLQMFLESGDLCKLVYQQDYSPSSATPITDTSVLLMQNIFPLPKDPNTITDKRSLLNVYFPRSKPYKRNTGFKEVEIYIDIICHLDNWIIDEGLRCFSIMDKIDKMLNDADIPSISMKKVFFEEDKIQRFSDYYYGYRLVYSVSQSSNVGC